MLLLCQGAAVPEMLVNQFSQYRMGTLAVISGFPVFQTVVVKKEKEQRKPSVKYTKFVRVYNYTYHIISILHQIVEIY